MIDIYTKFFKALGEPTRIKILKLLADKELCVCELMDVLNMKLPRISQHLRVLKEAGILRERKKAQWSYYSLNLHDFYNYIETFNTFLQKDIKDIAEFASDEYSNTRISKEEF